MQTLTMGHLTERNLRGKILGDKKGTLATFYGNRVKTVLVA